ncbi:Type IV pilus biogenesis protein PilM [Photobacterium marinum]|uniref:Type IV pilus biogenesis protein PilM n=1 Tax=Photobacterium marinum TaxID=1056511 RepID=L8J5A0_9GAMM|nr:type IV pilus assembly protein PilM [Photobacterium marinum]ELR63941.1 Type IV pilus biogenesis protein PilM [Photobacterium marinum]
MLRHPLNIGIDIGHHSVKAVVLSQKKERLELVAFTEAVLPASVINDQHSVNTPALLSVIRQLKKSLPFGASRVVLALPDSAVINKVIQIDTNLSDEEAEFAVTQALSASAPFPVEELWFDFYPLTLDAMASTAIVPYQIIAARRDTIDSRIAAIRKAGLKPRVVELQTHALLWIAAHTIEHSVLHEQWGIVDIGKCCTEFCVKPPGAAAYHRELAFGTRYIDKTVGGDTDAISVFTSSQAEAAQFTQQLAEQLRRQLQLYNSTHSRSQIKGIWLSGGGQHVVVDELLERLLNIEVQWMNPFRHLPCSKKLGEIAENSFYSQYAVATGLALRGMAA